MEEKNKPLHDATIKKMKPKDKDIPDTLENRGLRVTCGSTGIKSFFYRYKSPITNKLTQIQIGRYPTVSLTDARKKLKEYKIIRQDNRCPAHELKLAKEEEKKKIITLSDRLTVKDVIEHYLTEFIEDRVVDANRSP